MIPIRHHGQPVTPGLWEDERANVWRVHRDGHMQLVMVAEVDGVTDTKEQAEEALDSKQRADALDWLASQYEQMPDPFERVPALINGAALLDGWRDAA